MDVIESLVGFRRLGDSAGCAEEIAHSPRAVLPAALPGGQP